MRIAQATGLVVVWGPAGAGKRTLVRNWISSADAGSAMWIDSSGAASATGEYGAFIAAKITERDAAPETVVMDFRSRQVQPGDWDSLLSLSAEGLVVTVIVIACGAGLFWDRLSDGNRVTTLTPAGLWFDAVEIAELFAMHGISLHRRTARALAADTAGHAVLVDQALQIARLFGEDYELERQRAHDALKQMTDRYVEDQLLAQPGIKPLRNVAVALAAARTVSADTASILGGPDAVAALPMLEQAGLLVRKPRGEAFDYHFVPPIRLALAAIGRAERQESVDEGLARLARHYLSAGDQVAAVWHAAQADDWPLTIKILSRSWLEIAAAEFDVLGTVLSQIPEAVIVDWPALHSANSLLRSLRFGPNPGPRFPMAIDSVADLEVISAEYSTADALLVGTNRSVSSRIEGDFSCATALDDHLDALARRWEIERDRGASRGLEPNLPFLQMQWGLASFLHGDHVRGSTLCRRAFQDCGTGAMEFVASNAAGQLALHYAVLGEPAIADQWIRVEDSLDPGAGWMGSRDRVPAMIARSIVAIDRLDLDAAGQALAELGEIPDDLELWAFVGYARGMLDLYRGDAQIGIDRLRRLRAVFARWSTPSSLAAPLMQSIAMDLHAAVERPVEIQDSDGLAVPGRHPLVLVARARAAMLAGDPQAALADCDVLARDDGGYTRARLDGLVVEAVALSETGQQSCAVAIWNRAVAMAEDTGLIRPLAAVDSATLAALTAAGGTPLPAGHPASRFREKSVFTRRTVSLVLSIREQEVLNDLVGDCTVAQIAALHFVSTNTVKSQLRSLYRKLGVGTRQEALAVARQRGLL